MNNFVIDKEKSVAFTGHRDLPRDFDKNALENLIEKYILNGKENFLIGMAVGFDSVCFKAVEKLKKQYKNAKNTVGETVLFALSRHKPAYEI